LKKKHYYVLWSGGVDSTFLIDKLLKDGHKVTTGYVEITNNPNKDKIELKAIEDLRKIFSSRYPEFKFNGTIAKYEMIHTPVQLAINQPLFWLMSAIVCIPWECDSIAIGFIQKDDALSFLPEIQAAYKAMGKLRKDRLPKLEFPLIKYPKSSIYDLHHEMVELCSFCETPDMISEKAVPCGKCNKCTEMKRFIEYGWVGDHWFALEKARFILEDESEDVGEFAKMLIKLEDMDELSQEELRKAKLGLRDQLRAEKQIRNLESVDRKLSKLMKRPVTLGLKSMRDK
jgi:7-cyano-7-deazaguanine synthase in queuosine biosynthesis